ncbi:MAG: Gfo/Idh/MocA family oxidoreductase [Leptospiraceae bacterium]|nr:Gfo/Idh/MocA family oxidoreductase [Leptospiraceae bacterium]MCP5494156.1 Gfo/Idh/MocA family oxidoreductase [Leptospiraceae bacterium]
MENILKIGIIGVGHMGQYHVNVARMLSGVELVGLYDTDDTRLQQISEKYATKSFSKLEDLLGKCDALIIATPTYLHYEVSKKALLAGKHVLVEKPITESVEEARELVSIAKDKGLILQVGHVERFNGAVLELGKIVDSPILIESRRLAPYNARIRDVGVVLDMMIHDVDIVLNLVKSDVTFLSAIGSKVISDHEDAVSVQLAFQNGSIAIITASRCTQSKIRTLNITQRDAYIKLDFTDQEIELHRHATSNIQLGATEIKYRQESIVEKIFVHKDNPLKLEQEHFVNCILGKSMPQVSGEKDIQTLEIAHKILKEIHKH